MSLLESDRELARHSYYAATACRGRRHPPLAGATRCDVAIVGGGLAGVSAALDLAGRGLDVVLLEAGEIGGGASGRNGGQAIHGLACGQEVIEAQLGLDDARRIWNLTIEALDLLRERIARHAIDCEWQDGFLGVATSGRKAAELAAWAERIDRLYGYPLTSIPAADLARWIASPRYHGGVHDPRSGHLHPLKYTLGLAEAAHAAGVRIHEASRVTRVDRGRPIRLHTSAGEVAASHALLAANVHLDGVAPELARRIMPVGTYIACTDPLPPTELDELIPSRSAVCDTDVVLDYFRPTADHRLLFGGRVSYSARTPADLAQSLQRRIAAAFPRLSSAKIAYAWGGFVDITMNRAPDFGRLGPGLYYLQGFSGHGLALSGLAGRLVAEAITADAGRFDLFARLKHRDFPGGPLLRTPALVLGMAWYRLKDLM
jgi:gamma-glutamylputrescine oxidase